MEAKRFVATVMLTGTLLGAGAWVVHDALNHEAVYTPVVGCDDAAERSASACANVAIKSNADGQGSNSAELAYEEASSQVLVGDGLLVAGALVGVIAAWRGTRSSGKS